MMVKQNQIDNISGAAFIIEAGGSIDYLSLENNQFNDVGGVIPGADNFAAIFLQASVRADITNNVLDSIVRLNNKATIRAGIAVTSSGDVRITGNRLFSVTPASYTGLGAGIIISSNVGRFDVKNNEVSRVSDRDDNSTEKLSTALWLPLIVLGMIKSANNVERNTSKPSSIRFDSFKSSAAVIEASSSFADSVPVVSINNKAYAVLPSNMVNLGATALSDNSLNVSGNSFDATSSSTVAVLIFVPAYCGFMDNKVQSTTPDELVLLAAEHVAANNNRLMTTRFDGALMKVQAIRYVIMGNLSVGSISVIENGTINPLPEPWKSLNVFI